MTDTTAPPAGRPVRLVVNGIPTTLVVEPRVSLLDALREDLHLTGTKKGCNQGACGACTVLVDGRRIVSCLALAVQYDGHEVTTIEGVGPHPLQEAFVHFDGLQCGYCTPGQICSAIGMLAEHELGAPSAVTDDVAVPAALTRNEIRERMSGNLCRCGAYNGIVDAIESVGTAPSGAVGMKPFDYERATDVAQAVTLVAERPGSRFLAGGTNLVDLVRRGVETPDRLVDVTGLPLAAVEEAPGSGLRIGAVVTNADLAHHPLVRTHYPLLAEAVLAGASGQLRTMATVGGNLLQRTRCPYFMDLTTACNKRDPGSGRAARGGFTRYAGVLGTSDHCVAVHPSDMAVALAALDARVELTSAAGVREVAVTDLYRLPGKTPHLDTVLAPGELVTAVLLPPSPAGASHYRKVRDRASYAFALVSVATVLGVEDGRVTTVRLALGGVAPRPWRAATAESLLFGAEPTDEAFGSAVDAELADAKPLPGNEFKIGLTRRTVVGAELQRLRDGEVGA